MAINTTAYLTAYVGEIGKIVFVVSTFDDDLSRLLSESLCLNRFQENVLLRPLSTRTKIDTLNRLARLFMKGEQLKRLTKWCETAKDRLEDRNALVHGQPGQEGDEVTFRIYSGKHGIFGEPEVWSIDRVCDVRDYFIDALEEIATVIRPQFETWIEDARVASRLPPSGLQIPPGKSA